MLAVLQASSDSTYPGGLGVATAQVVVDTVTVFDGCMHEQNVFAILASALNKDESSLVGQFPITRKPTALLTLLSNPELLWRASLLRGLLMSLMMLWLQHSFL